LENTASLYAGPIFFGLFGELGEILMKADDN
jgi:hypothetical protein